MRVVFVCTGNTFTSSVLYKENYFIKAAVNFGYEVLVIASEYQYVEGKREKTQLKEGRINGYHLVRIPYKKYFHNEYISDKIRNAVGLTDTIIRFRPQFVFYNCSQIYNVLEIQRLRKSLPECRIVLDFSTKFINSARNFLSLYVLHKGLYRYWLKKAVPFVDRIFYVSDETKDFIQEVYHLPRGLLEENGVPGEVIPLDRKVFLRDKIRKKYKYPEDTILFVHSGKIGVLKRTVELLHYFKENTDLRLRLLIAGSLEDKVKEQVLTLIEQDKRVQYVGFVTGDILSELLCAADLYLQPGTISQTSQTAICCGTPIMFMKCPTNEAIFDGNGFILEGLDEIPWVFDKICKNPNILRQMVDISYKIAYKKLDYENLLKRAMGLEISDEVE